MGSTTTVLSHSERRTTRRSIMQSNFMLGGDPLSLDRIRSVLVRLEDTIIFSLIERAQFAHNPKIYERGAFSHLKEFGEFSWLEWFLKETEIFHAKARRYTSPDEYPFTENLPEPVLPALHFPKILHPNKINVNPSVLSFYVNSIVPRITRRATLVSKRVNGDAELNDDGNYGSAATIDIEAMQSISKRVHYGKFVSESKFQANPAAFIPHILKPNPEALNSLITKPEVERRLLQRLRKKAATYAQDVIGEDAPSPCVDQQNAKLDVDGVVDFYENWLIPLTKKVEVDYLLRRLDGLSQEDIDALMQKSPKNNLAL